MSMYTCDKCGRTLKYDRSWHKNPPSRCGRCTRIVTERFMRRMEAGQ